MKSLKGDAATTLEQGFVTGGSYQEAWERLMSVYNNPYRIASNYLRDFYRLPVLQSPASAPELKKMSDIAHETIR